MIFRTARSILARSFSLTARCNEQEDTKRLLKVALVGAPNAGKSTLLNKLICSDVSCVSKKVHTTRNNILGVYTQDKVQVEFYDSPGIITGQHVIKHNIERSMVEEPKAAASICDLIAVVVDVANIREQKRLNKGTIELLRNHSEKRSVLILNKVDLVKDKRQLLDISTRLTQGCLQGELTIDKKELYKMGESRLKALNILHHLHSDVYDQQNDPIYSRPKHKYVIELENPRTVQGSDAGESKYFDPNSISYPKFSFIFSISALNDDGVDELRDHLLDLAHPVDSWPHSPDYLTDQSAKDIVTSIIRGKILNLLPNATPYLLKYHYNNFSTDENGSLIISLKIVCPERYMVSKVIGQNGVTIWQVINESREIISRSLGCDVKLDIEVKPAKSN